MAKVEGGLLSRRPHGTIGGIITYQGRRSYFHAHRKATPTDRKSIDQLSQRNDLTLAVAVWHKLTPGQKSFYNTLAQQYNNNPGYNIFLTLNIGKVKDWKRFAECKFGATYKFGGPILK